MSVETTKLVVSTNRRTNGVNNTTTTFYDPHLHGYESANPSIEVVATSHQENSAKSIVLGGIDGITASYLIISAAAGAGLHWSYFIVLGFANILANAVSIGVSEFFSSKLHREFILAEKRRATWQYKNFRDEEVRGMVSKLEMKGMSKQDAELVVGKFALYEDVFVNFLLVEELGMNLPDEDDGASLFDAVIMLMSYAFFGSIPVAVYGFGLKIGDKQDSLFLASTIVTTAVLIVLGSVKSTFSSTNWIYTSAETLFTTGLCAIAAYSLAYAIADLLGEYI